MSRFSSRALASRRDLLEALLAEQGASLPDRIPRRTAGGPVPASFAQRRLWFLEQLEPGSTAYTIAGALPLRGPLHVAALERALNEVVRRHESLRTTFTAPAGEPLQVVAPELELPLAVHFVRDDAHRRALARAEAGAPFDLECGPLLRAVLLRLGGDEQELLLTMHHIVSDGWSLEVLYRELRTLYAAFAAGEPSPLPELAIQYPDFALWQRGQAGDEQLDHWRRRLAGAPTVLELPADRSRPAAATHAGGAESLLLGASDSAALRALAAAEEATPFMLTVSAFAVLAHRMTGQDDLLIGTPVAGRTRAETEPLIGFFVNTLALRVDLSGRPSFRALLRRVRATVLEALA
ncbi:MAG TPA: condensation domain-containing protein, partial [Solirubrobacteraceae bacterium]